MQPILRSYILIHFAVLLFGITAILGALIELQALPLVWWRVIIASISLLFFTKGISFLKTLPWSLKARFIWIGAIISIHWLTFFASVKLAGASISLVCMATTCLFLSLIEPLILKKPFNRFDILIALSIIPGMILVVQNISESRYWGVIMGLISASLAAVFSTLNKKYIHQTSIWNITWIEMTSAAACLSIILFIYLLFMPDLRWVPTNKEWIYLIILGFLCTTVAHAMSLSALRYISAFALNLVVNLEPVYGIILAVILLNENKDLNKGFYLGASLILLTVFLYPYLKNQIQKKNGSIR